MTLLAISFIAGVLTVLAPCVLPLLPVVIGVSVGARSKFTPYIVVGSLGISVIVFTYLLKASTVFIMVPPEFWTILSGVIILAFGLVLIFPSVWENIPGMAKLSARSNQALGQGYQKKSFWGDVIIGASLGPIFSTCSPTYFVILASVLPVSFALGTTYILAYVVGLSIVLLLIALLGQRFADKLTGFASARSKTKITIGVIFIVLGLLIATGYEKKLETAILDSGFFDITRVEQYLLERVDDNESGVDAPDDNAFFPYKEIVNPSGFVNTPRLSSGQASSITVEQFVGEKVILVDFMTYSCINCQRTFPYLNAWYEKYKDDGLIIVGIHTPEFAFEKDIENVRVAMKKFGINHPVVLDNDYATWRNWGNRYWPRKYLIDIEGNVVYDHIGEGGYDETERKIRELLRERAEVLGLDIDMESDLASSGIEEKKNETASPETYFGALRNEYFANGTPGEIGTQTFALPKSFPINRLYLGGTWTITEEYTQSVLNSSVLYHYYSREVYVVAEADKPINVEVWQDGELIDTIVMQASELYTVVSNDTAGEHVLELRIKGDGLRLFAFTFG